MNGAAVPYGSKSTQSTRSFSDRWEYINELYVPSHVKPPYRLKSEENNVLRTKRPLR